MSLVFGNFCFDYYGDRFGLGLRLGLDIIMKYLRTMNMRQAFSKLF